jgi:YD repeat-containing protein
MITVVAAGSAGAASAAETIDYTYDAQGRLIKVERSGTVNNDVDTDYEYDDADNRTREKITGSTNLPPP